MKQKSFRELSGSYQKRVAWTPEVRKMACIAGCSPSRGPGGRSSRAPARHGWAPRARPLGARHSSRSRARAMSGPSPCLPAPALRHAQ
jgi:hypothetical protein